MEALVRDFVEDLVPGKRSYQDLTGRDSKVVPSHSWGRRFFLHTLFLLVAQTTQHSSSEHHLFHPYTRKLVKFYDIFR